MEVFKSHQNIFNKEELTKVFELLERNKDDYYFRSSVNQLLARTITRIDLIADQNDLFPWEIEHDDKVVKTFLSLHPKLSSLSIDELVHHKEFLDYVKSYAQKIRVQYKTGAIRHIFLGGNFSLIVDRGTMIRKANK